MYQCGEAVYRPIKTRKLPILPIHLLHVFILSFLSPLINPTDVQA